MIGGAKNHGTKLAWTCSCDCGASHIAAGVYLRNGTVKSCGCLRRDLGVERGRANRKHGHGSTGKESVEYRTWGSMRSRCLNSGHKQYANYGGRGITICQRWLDSFQAFFDDMGSRPSKAHSIDRIDNSKGYSPENCRWATRKEQNRNKRGNVLLTIKGRTMPISGWVEESPVCGATVHRRLAAGIDPEEAVFRSAHKGKRHD